MKTVIPFVLFLALLSCSSKDSAVRKKLRGCDSLVITFNIPDTDSVINIVSTTDTKAIQKLARYLDGKPAEKSDCGFDGNMQFFKSGTQVMPVVFKYSKGGCRVFTFDLDNTVMKMAMTNDAADFLQSLAENKPWY